MTVAPPSLSLRMYKGLLGDCFLLQLADGPDKSAKILIDCGMLQGIPGGGETMRKVAQNVVADTQGHIDLLVVTHRHFDHISGFQYAHDLFFGGALRIDNLWLAWAENAADPQAAALWGRANRAAKVVRMAAQNASQLAALGVAGADQVTMGLAEFLGPQAGDGDFGPKVMEDLKASSKPAYLEPGQVLQTPGEVSLTAYVLGPPRGDKLFDSDPSASKPETYLGAQAISSVDGMDDAAGLLALLDARPALAGSATDALLPDLFDEDDYAVAVQTVSADVNLSPFPSRYSHFQPPRPPVAGQPPPPADPVDDAARAWFTEIYLSGPDWRRIDAAWLGTATRLAQRLDRNINNTSLALAFETPAGKVLLFPGDAQVGNWLSWSDQTFPSKVTDNATGAEGITIEEILGRVVFYKVGHHCSRNATLESEGLQIMGTQGGLVAMIPVVETYAHAQAGGGWNMPFPPLYAALLDRTEGRLLRGDSATGKDAKGVTLTTDAAFLAQVDDGPDDLYVQYRLPAALIGAFSETASAQTAATSDAPSPIPALASTEPDNRSAESELTR